VARDPPDRLHDRVRDHGAAGLFADMAGMKRHLLDHGPSQDRELVFVGVRRRHGSSLRLGVRLQAGTAPAHCCYK